MDPDEADIDRTYEHLLNVFPVPDTPTAALLCEEESSLKDSDRAFCIKCKKKCEFLDAEDHLAPFKKRDRAAIEDKRGNVIRDAHAGKEDVRFRRSGLCKECHSGMSRFVSKKT